jgi:hypothetical protein
MTPDAVSNAERDQLIASLMQQEDAARSEWQAMTLAHSRRSSGAPYHPLLPGVLALCISSGDPGEADRFSEENVTKQLARYLGVLTAAASAPREPLPSAELAALLERADDATSATAKWVLDRAGTQAIDAFASDAILFACKRELLDVCKQGRSDDADARALFEYRVLVAYMSALIAERKHRAELRVARRDAEQGPATRVAAFFSLIGSLPSPPLAPAGAVALAIGAAQLAQTMRQTVDDMESTARRDAIEAALADDADRLAEALAGKPFLWRLIVSLAAAAGLQAALTAASPAVGLAFEVIQDMTDLRA